MRITASALAAILLGTAAMAAVPDNTEALEGSGDIFPSNFFHQHTNPYDAWAICRGKVTRIQFPNLQAPTQAGGCVRYFQGIDMTGVVTEAHFFHRDGANSACDCIAICLARPASCTNWVWKFAFLPGDDGLRSCTIYSSPNLPTNVTLAYNLDLSSGFEVLQPTNNPQAGALAPLTFRDAALTQPDTLGVSGFTVQDQLNRQYC